MDSRQVKIDILPRDRATRATAGHEENVGKFTVAADALRVAVAAGADGGRCAVAPAATSKVVIGRLHVPSGNGPASQGPPWLLARVQT